MFINSRKKGIHKGINPYKRFPNVCLIIRVPDISDPPGAGQSGAREGGGETLHHRGGRGGIVRQDGLQPG